MEKIGAIIRNHRIAKNMTQEELGKKIFVSKQAVSKWETGKTLPDIETIRLLCNILDIDKDDILGGSIKETKKNRKYKKLFIIISLICILTISFWLLDITGYINRNTQAGIAFVTLFNDGELIDTDKYSVTSLLKSSNLKSGYKFDIDYGEIRGDIIFDKYKIDFGFINTNNWHNIQIRIDIKRQNDSLLVTQTISYETDNDLFKVITNEVNSANNTISIFREGI